jgi:collagenase-like PrtC family protease
LLVRNQKLMGNQIKNVREVVKMVFLHSSLCIFYDIQMCFLSRFLPSQPMNMMFLTTIDNNKVNKNLWNKLILLKTIELNKSPWQGNLVNISILKKLKKKLNRNN